MHIYEKDTINEKKCWMNEIHLLFFSDQIFSIYIHKLTYEPSERERRIIIITAEIKKIIWNDKYYMKMEGNQKSKKEKIIIGNSSFIFKFNGQKSVSFRNEASGKQVKKNMLV